ncbi:MAG TPA: hypothetical protein VGI58_11785 [Streptosporangiaceae bacterium]
MDLQDATLMFLIESSGHPSVRQLAQTAYDRLAEGQSVDHHVLSDLLGEASGKGVLREMHQKYGPVAHEAIIMPICREIGRQRPIPSRRRPPGYTPEPDPLTAPIGGF